MTTSSNPRVLAIDLGTSALKAAIVDGRGKHEHSIRIPYAYGNSPDGWQMAILRACKKIDLSGVDAVAVAAQGPTLVGLDAQGAIIPEATTYYYDEKSDRIPGQKSFFLPKIVVQKESGVYHRVYTYLSVGDYITYLLTGKLISALPREAFRELMWTTESLEAYQIDAYKLPPLVPYGSSAGTVSREAAAKYGLAQGIPVATSMFDFLAALIGSDSTSSGTVLNRAGTSEGFNLCMNEDLRQKLSFSEKWVVLPHPIEGLYNAGYVVNDSSSRDINDRAAQFLATVESVGRENISRIYLCGGQSYLEDLNQLKAQKSSMSLTRLYNPEAELSGACALALTTIGHMSSLKEAAAAILRPGTVYTPS